jgi:hypothetical protein
MSSNQDPARLIAERVARRLAGDSPAQYQAPAPVSEPVSQRPRARIIDFVSTSAPTRTEPSIGAPPKTNMPQPAAVFTPQVAQSPWLAPFTRATPQANSADHPSQERFGVEEAAVSELVEFFENEKQCSVDPSGKPCDHCAMCSSRGF